MKADITIKTYNVGVGFDTDVISTYNHLITFDISFIKGDTGKSAYQHWLDNGNTGTEAEFLESLKGADGYSPVKGTDYNDGKSAYQLWLDEGNQGTISNFLQSLKGTSVSIRDIYEDNNSIKVTFSTGNSISIPKGKDGASPIITSIKLLNKTTIMSNGLPIASIDDGEPGPKGDTGESGVYCGTEEPGEDYDVWIDPEDTDIPSITASVTNIPGGKRVNLSDGTHFDVMDGVNGHTPTITATKNGTTTTIKSDGVAIANIQDGQNGNDGNDADPLTITSQSLDANGNRVLVFSDGTSVTIPKGQQGSSATATDVQINGTSIVTDGVANIGLSGSLKYDKVSNILGIEIPSNATIDSRVVTRALVLSKIDYAVKAAMCDGRGASWSDTEKASARERMGIVTLTQEEYDLIESPNENTIYIIV